MVSLSMSVFSTVPVYLLTHPENRVAVVLRVGEMPDVGMRLAPVVHALLVFARRSLGAVELDIDSGYMAYAWV